MEIRRNPFTGERVLVSPHRLSRPWQPESFCPFCPGAPETGQGWEVLLLPNRYPVVTRNPPTPTQEELFQAEEAYGQAYVLVETPQHDLDDLSDLPPSQIEKVLRLVMKAQKEAEEDPKALYFLFFRNKGREIGVSLTHPHSQIYILPVVPPRVETELRASEEWYRERGTCLHCLITTREEKRIVYQNASWKSFVPYYARWPHEVHIYPKRHVSHFTALREDEIGHLADMLRKTLCAFKTALGKPMPYIMVLHQAPLRVETPHYHLHFEIYGMYRPDGKLKYAAGAELGASLYTLDTTPEETAERLRKALANCVINNRKPRPFRAGMGKV
jgi:UDPglucose--hexose-1-phosphate uridylyltransferase